MSIGIINRLHKVLKIHAIGIDTLMFGRIRRSDANVKSSNLEIFPFIRV